MEWKYPYVKRPLKERERSALINFVLALIFLGIAITILIYKKQIPRENLIFVALSFSFGLGILSLINGFADLKKGGL